MKQQMHGFARKIALALLFVAGISGSAWAVDRTFQVDGGEWSAGANWNPAGVPADGDDAWIDDVGAAVSDSVTTRSVPKLGHAANTSGSLTIKSNGLFQAERSFSIGLDTGSSGTVTVEKGGRFEVNANGTNPGFFLGLENGKGTATLDVSGEMLLVGTHDNAGFRIRNRTETHTIRLIDGYLQVAKVVGMEAADTNVDFEVQKGLFVIKVHDFGGNVYEDTLKAYADIGNIDFSSTIVNEAGWGKAQLGFSSYGDLDYALTYEGSGYTNVLYIDALAGTWAGDSTVVSMWAETFDPFLEPPAVDVSVDRLITTPSDRLRVNYELSNLPGATVHMAVLDAGSNKVEFTAFDDRSVNSVRNIYTTKAAGVPAAVTNAASDFTTSGFFQSLTNDPFTFSIPVDNSMEALDELDLTALVNPSSVWKAGSEQVVYIDLPSIVEIAGTSSNQVLTVQVTASNGVVGSVVGEVDVTIVPDGSLTITKISSEITDAAAFAATQDIMIGSEGGNSGNRFTHPDTADDRHPYSSYGNASTQYAPDNAERCFGMYFDCTNDMFITDMLINMYSDAGSSQVPAGSGMVKFELWKVQDKTLSELSLTDPGKTFPHPRELVFAGTGSLDTAGIVDQDIYKIEFPEDIQLDADTRYGWFVRLIETTPMSIYLGVDRGASFPDGNHLRQNGKNFEEFPFFGQVTAGGGAWDLIFFLNGYSSGPFEAWAVSKELIGSGAARSADPDEDGNDNLVEYALDGDPNVSDASALQILRTTDVGGTNYFEYVYKRRLDAVARGLTYTLTDRASLTLTSWATNTTAEVAAGPIDAEFESVTNRWPTDTHPIQFIQLQIEEN